MKYQKNVKKISTALAKYKTDVDTLEGLYKIECKKVKSEAERMRGKWTNEYIDKYISEHNPDSSFKTRLQKARAEAEPIVLDSLDRIQKSLDSYFNAPIKPDFANKIMSIKLSGLQLSDLEFSILQGSATSYMERRLLNQLAESRTKKDTILEFDDKGTPHSREANIGNPYINLELPDIDGIYKQYQGFASAAKSLLYQYSGTNAEMAHLLDQNVPNYISITSDAFFRCGHEESFTKIMEKANSILPESKVKHELTDNDKKLIDLLIDEKYPSLAKEKAKKLAEADSDIGELLALDDRYKEVFEE